MRKLIRHPEGRSFSQEQQPDLRLRWRAASPATRTPSRRNPRGRRRPRERRRLRWRIQDLPGIRRPLGRDAQESLQDRGGATFLQGLYESKRFAGDKTLVDMYEKAREGAP